MTANDRKRKLAGLRRAAREALLFHARLGNPVAISRDGKIVHLSPAEVFSLIAEMDAEDARNQASSS